MSTMGKNRLHALMLMNVDMNILDNVNLTDAAHDSVGRKDNCKQTFRHFSSNYSQYIND